MISQRTLIDWLENPVKRITNKRPNVVCQIRFKDRDRMIYKCDSIQDAFNVVDEMRCRFGIKYFSICL